MSSEYTSLRLRNTVHKLRYGVQPLLVEAGGEQTITFLEEPFPHFVVDPSGVQIPLHNVASAVPSSAALAAKVGKTVGQRQAQREQKLAERAEVVAKRNAVRAERREAAVTPQQKAQRARRERERAEREARKA